VVIVGSLLAWASAVCGLVLVAVWSNPITRAVLLMAWGPMIWLPAHTLLPDRGARPPRWWAYPVAVFFPFLFLPTLFVLAPWLWLGGDHPGIHFPPIAEG
jgi:hypothetical protein